MLCISTKPEANQKIHGYIIKLANFKSWFIPYIEKIIEVLTMISICYFPVLPIHKTMSNKIHAIIVLNVRK